MIAGEAIRAATERLSATSDTARLDAELLMAHAFGVTRSGLLLHHMRDPVPASFAALVERRLEHEPVAYIVGSQEFYGLEFDVGPGVLIPRADSETIIDAAKELFSDRSPARILDLGAGSGCLILTALSIWPDAAGVAIERSAAALPYLVRNAARHASVAAGSLHGPGRGTFELVQRDWTRSDWRDGLGRFDLILANPPYVEEGALLAASVLRHEPAAALFAGPEGLADYRVLIPNLAALLAPGGAALVEIGHSQGDAVGALGAACGLEGVLHRDLAGRPRVLEFKIPLGKAPARA